MKKLMHFLARLFPYGETGENPAAIRAYHSMMSIKEKFSEFPGKVLNRTPGNKGWPVVPGNYSLGDPGSPVAVCTLTSHELIKATASLSKVAISGGLYTPNLGIEKIILNCTANPDIRFLLLCGKESRVFYPGQALASLIASGVDQERRIVGAKGNFPVLRNVRTELINQFLDQVRIVDATGETDPAAIQSRIRATLKKYGSEPYQKEDTRQGRSPGQDQGETFIEIKPGGKRIPIDYDQKGYFVITTEPAARQILVRHYHKDNTPGFSIKGHSAESILLALIREKLVSQLSHAGYLGAELNKAETSIRLDLPYQQDMPLRIK